MKLPKSKLVSFSHHLPSSDLLTIKLHFASPCQESIVKLYLTESPFRDTSAETAQHPISISRIPRGGRGRISVFNPWVWIRGGDAADWNKVGMDPPLVYFSCQRGVSPHSTSLLPACSCFSAPLFLMPPPTPSPP